MATNDPDHDPETQKNADNGSAMAKMLLTPGFSHARAIKALEGSQRPSQIDLIELKEALEAQVEAMKASGSEQHEAMLWDQSVTLQQMFVRLIERASQQTRAEHHTKLLQLALRAQNQSRATLQALADLRTPRSHVFARQANVAQNQQINHAQPPVAPSSENDRIEQDELMEDDTNAQWLDTGTQGSTGRGNPELETVGTFHRPPDS